MKQEEDDISKDKSNSTSKELKVPSLAHFSKYNTKLNLESAPHLVTISQRQHSEYQQQQQQQQQQNLNSLSISSLLQSKMASVQNDQQQQKSHARSVSEDYTTATHSIKPAITNATALKLFSRSSSGTGYSTPSLRPHPNSSASNLQHLLEKASFALDTKVQTATTTIPPAHLRKISNDQISPSPTLRQYSSASFSVNSATRTDISKVNKQKGSSGFWPFSRNSSGEKSQQVLHVRTSPTTEHSKPSKIKDIFMTHYKPFSEVLTEISSSNKLESSASSSLSNVNLVESSLDDTTIDNSEDKSENAKTLQVLLSSFQEVSITSPPSPSASTSTHTRKTTSKSPVGVNNARLFDFFGIMVMEEMKPVIMYRYPSQNTSSCPEELISNLPLFCFPDIQSQTPALSNEIFSFVLTLERATESRKHAYCKRIKSSNPSFSSVVFCLVTSVGSGSMYNDVLSIIEVVYALGNDALESLMEMLWMQRCPRPGKILEFVACQQHFRISRSIDDSIVNEGCLRKLFGLFGIVDSRSITVTNLPFMRLVALISAMLMEKQIIVTSNSLQLLSDTCTGILSTIYPLEWQHIYIPILPGKLLDVVCSPTPYLVGVLSSDLFKIISVSANGSLTTRMDGFVIDNCVIFNADTGKIICKDLPDLEKNFPTFLLSKLKSLIDAVFQEKTDSSISEALTSFYLFLFGNYRESIEVDIKTLKPRNAGKSWEPVMADQNQVKWIQKISNQNRTISQSSSEELLSITSEIHVWFDFDNFINEHPLVCGNLEHYKFAGSNTRAISQNQRQAIRKFFEDLRHSHNFLFFIQQREEAFQYHYQLQLDLSHGIKSDSLPSGLKQYYTIAQSSFEHRISQAELTFKPK